MIISNISHLTSSSGRGVRVRIAGEDLRPGKTKRYPDEVVTERHRGMFGRLLREGPIPLQAKKVAPVAPMTEKEIRLHLERLTLADLHALADAVVPALSKRANHKRMAHGLLRSIRTGILDPEAFFFLRRWRNLGGNVYEPVE